MIKFEISTQIIEKYTKTKFNENQSSGNRIFPCRQTDRGTWRNFAKAPKNQGNYEKSIDQFFIYSPFMAENIFDIPEPVPLNSERISLSTNPVLFTLHTLLH